jgi:hypothetical protein
MYKKLGLPAYAFISHPDRYEASLSLEQNVNTSLKAEEDGIT